MNRTILTILFLQLFAGSIHAQNDDEDYGSFVKSVINDYDSFREEVNKDYAKFMENAWKSYGIEKPIEQPKSQKIEPVEYDKDKELKLLLAKKKKLQEDQNQLNEQQKKQEELQQKLAEQERQQQDALQKLSQEQQDLAEAKKKLEEERQKFIQEAKRKLEEDQKQLLTEKEQQQKQSEEKEKQLAEKQKQLEDSVKKQEEQKKLLDDEKKSQEQQNKLLAEERKRQEEERQKLQEEQNKKLEEELQKLGIEKKKLDDDRQKFIVEMQKQKEALQNDYEVRKKELEHQQKLIEENEKKQIAQKQLLEEEKKKQEEQKKLLAEEKTKREQRQKEIEQQKKELDEGKAIQAEIVAVKEDAQSQPQPVAPIKENKETIAKNTFNFYGTPMEVRWGNADHFKLAGTDKKSISNAYIELTSSGYDNLLHDCLALRKEKDLCDWAYYKMLQNMAEAACGEGTNESVFLQGVLYQQSGYMMRFGLDSNQKLHILSRLNGTVYDRCHWIVEDNVGNRVFFLMDGSKPKSLEICDVPYPKEQPMSFNIPKLPKLSSELSDDRTITSRFVSVEAKSAVNKNMIDFFNEYPASFRDNDVTTRWPYYANAPVSQEVKDKLYPQLRRRIANAPKLMAANMLLNWVQMGLDYAIDEKVWGSDRAFFAEETLYYPLCDCEDRSILFSHLVRDLLNLDVVMVYYPNNPQHMYTAVSFDEDVKGDYIMVNGRKFIIADPTCYNANVGHTMNQMDNSKAKVIPLKRDKSASQIKHL